MKKIRLTSVFVIGSLILSINSFGQNQQINQNINSGNSISNSTQPVLNGNTYNQRSVPNNLNNAVLNSNSNFQQNNSGPVSAGQHNCKTHELNQKHYQDRGILQQFNQSYLTGAQSTSSFPTKTSGVNEISIIFHVVHNPNNPAENVSNALIMQVYNDIVEDFKMLNLDPVRSGFGFTPANPNINFCLATRDPMGNPLAETGVIRVATTEGWYDSDNGEENKMKSSATGGSQIWNRNNYLNVWICDISNGASSGTAGYAYRPTTSYLPGSTIDGIVLDYNLGMNNENVLTHEIGHYLGLDHTWGGSGGCGVDDGFADTPVTAGPSFNYPGSCSASQQTCSGVQTQFENFMDYANCTAMFTQQQANYMLSILQGIRGSLLLSPGCDPTNTPPNSVFASVPAGPAPVIIPQSASVSFIDQSTNVPTGWTWTISGTQGVDWVWSGATNQNSQNPTATFYTVGNYNVTLTASNAYGADLTPASINAYVQVVAVASGNACDTLRNYITTEPYYVLSNVGGGYLDGNANLSGQNAVEWAERYTAATSTQVRALEFLPAKVSNGGGSITFKIYSNNAGVPGTVLASEVVPLSSMAANTWENISFTTPATVTGQFWVGYQLSYGVGDTFALRTNYNGALPASHTFLNRTTSGWLNAGTTYGGIRLAFIMDVLTSNGTAPLADFNSSSNEICIGGNVAVDGSISTNTNSYEWYVTNDPVVTVFQTSTSSSNNFNFPYAAGNYRVILFANGSCLSDGVYMPVILRSKPTATVTPTATTCGNNNGIITITSPTGGGGTYYYSINGVNYQTANTFTNLAPGSYTVSVATLDAVTGNTLGSGCITTYTVNVGTSSPISPTVSANTAICPSGTASITAGGGTGYNWYNGATLVASTASVNVSPAVTTQYSCVVTNGACSATVYTTVTVRPTPATPIITPSGPTTICAGQDIDLTSSYGTGNVWSTTETSSVITVTTAGPFTVRHTDAFGCLSAISAPMSITINPIPVITSGTVSNPSACSTTTGSIQVAGTGTGSVSWTGTASGTATSITLPYNIPNLGAGSYDITFVDGIGCTSNTLTIALSDPTPPSTPTITPGGPTTFCTGGSVTLTSSQATGNVWSANAGSATSQMVTATSSGNYTVTYTDGLGCSATSAPISIVVNSLPAIPTITPSGATTFCAGGSVNLSSSQGTGNVWSANAGSATSQVVAVNASGSYTVTYTNANGCSRTSAPTVITVNPLPVITTGTVSSPTTCATATGSIQVNGTGTGDLSWTGTASGNSSGITLPFTIPTLAAGSYNINFEDGNGCISTTLTVPLSDPTPPATPTISASGSTTFCAGGSVTLTSSQPSGNVWSTTETTSSIVVNSTNSYTVTYTDGSGCSATSAPTVVTVNALPTVTQSALGTVCVYNSPIILSGGSPASGTYSGTGVSSGTFNPATAGTGTHTITYTYTDGNNCSNTATADITVDGCLSIGENDLTDVKVYPNPVQMNLTIEVSGDFNYEILDTKGRLIAKGNGNEAVTVNTAEYTSGVYFVSLTSEKINTTIRVMKN